jgi:hypothetical protein
MKIEKLEKLETAIDQKDYEKANRGKGNLWNVVGYFLQGVNILICLLGLYGLMDETFGVFTGSLYLYGLISIGILGAWELLKRTTVIDLTFGWMKNKGLTKSLSGSFILALILVGGSGYLAVHGIQQITDRTNEVETVVESNSQVIIDSLNVSYGNQIKQLEDRITVYYTQAELKERALYTREAAQVSEIEAKIKSLKDEHAGKVSLIKKEAETKLSSTKEDIGSRVIKFLLITITIELFIVLSIIITSLVDFKSYRFKANSSEYKGYKLTNTLLNIFYNNGKFGEGDDCPSQSKFEDLIKLKGLVLTKNEINLFITLLQSKDIIQTKGNKRRFTKTFVEAQAEIKQYYNFS